MQKRKVIFKTPVTDTKYVNKDSSLHLEKGDQHLCKMKLDELILEFMWNDEYETTKRKAIRQSSPAGIKKHATILILKPRRERSME